MSVSTSWIPYSRHFIDSDDVDAVTEALYSDWLTQGNRIGQFEAAVANFCGASHAVAVSSGTAALHAAMFAAGIQAGDEVIIPAITFASTANAVVFQGGTPVFADVDPETLLVDPSSVESKITPQTKAIAAVDYAGQPCDYDRLRQLAERHQLVLIADASHSLGAEFKNRKVGTLADLTTFSFHAIKHVATGEGGMVVTNRAEYVRRMSLFRNHGISTDLHARSREGTWHYEMVELGFNYRITDFQCALGMSQLKKLERSIERRREIAAQYDEAFKSTPGIKPLQKISSGTHAYHLYVIRINNENQKKRRAEMFSFLRQEGIGVNVHYLPVYLHPFYRNRFQTAPGLCPNAESAYEKILSLPIYYGLTNEAVLHVITQIKKAADCH